MGISIASNRFVCFISSLAMVKLRILLSHGYACSQKGMAEEKAACFHCVMYICCQLCPDRYIEFLFLGTPRVPCVPNFIKGKNSAVGKKLSKHKRGTQYTLHSSDGTLNFTLWKDGSVVQSD